MLHLHPLRKPRASNISTTIFHYSHKLKRQVWCESNLEWNVAILLDHDATVMDYCEQAIKIPNGKTKWTPDFVILYKNGKRQIIEVKSISELRGEEKDELFKKFLNAENWAQKNGYEFQVVTELNLKKSNRVLNCRRYSLSEINNSINNTLVNVVKNELSNYAGKTISEISNQIPISISDNREDLLRTINLMVYQGNFDLNFEEEISNSTRLNKVVNKLQYTSLEYWLRDPFWKNQELPEQKFIQNIDLNSIPLSDLRIAQERLEIITPLLPNSSKENVFRVSQNKRISSTTLWRWLQKYRLNNDIRALIPQYHKKGKKKRFTLEDEIILYAMNLYLILERPTVKAVYEKLVVKAEDMGLKYPSYRTLLRILNSVDKKQVVKGRYGTRKAENDFFVSVDSFPHSVSALQTVQIDHTPIDVKLVDEENRESIGRPFLTIAIDVHSRVILGYCLTFDNPSRLSIATTLISCIEKKDLTLRKVRDYYPELDEGLLNKVENSKWNNVFGLPHTIHIDNGPDFISNDMKTFARSYGIHLHYRPVKGAQYGGHVERYLGTLNKRLQSIPGTTFSNRTELHEYDSDKRAIYTINELEARIITELVLYHNGYHEGIKTTPLDAWEASFTDQYKFQSSLKKPKDNSKFRIDVLPSKLRTIQKSGISIFGLKYKAEILRSISSQTDSNTGKKRKFIIRYDPRDIRQINLYNPIKEGYYIIQCNDILFNRLLNDKAVSLWEWNAINKKVQNIGKSKERRDIKIKMVSTQLEMDEISSKKTKSQRKRNSIRKKRLQDIGVLENENLSTQIIEKEVKKKEYTKKEIDWSKVKKLPTDNMYRGK